VNLCILGPGGGVGCFVGWRVSACVCACVACQADTDCSTVMLTWTVHVSSAETGSHAHWQAHSAEWPRPRGGGGGAAGCLLRALSAHVFLFGTCAKALRSVTCCVVPLRLSPASTRCAVRAMLLVFEVRAQSFCVTTVLCWQGAPRCVRALGLKIIA
jgi:hypothetical protein